MADDQKRGVVWRSLLIDGRTGTIAVSGSPRRWLLASYEIHCAENSLTHRVRVARAIGSNVKTLSLSMENRGTCRRTGQELREIQGRDDVDLAVTPATNTLAISRLSLKSGIASQ
jgi:hypothetical protein